MFSTSRCYVREFEKKDIDDFMKYRNNLNWMKYQTFKGLLKEEYVEILTKSKDIEKGIQLAIFLKENDELLGDLYIQREDNILWLGYTISPSKARKKFMFEVISALLKKCRNTNIHTIKAEVDIENIASINLLKKLNFKLEQETDEECIYKMDISKDDAIKDIDEAKKMANPDRVAFVKMFENICNQD